MSKYETKPGEGTLWPNEPRDGSKHPNAPAYKGSLVLPNGDVIGLALWRKETGNGKVFLSLAIDDREGEFQAKRMGRAQMSMTDTKAPERGRGEQRKPDRYSDGGGFDPDLDDDIPF